MQNAIIIIGALTFIAWILDQEIKLKAYRKRLQNPQLTGLALACKNATNAIKRLNVAMGGLDNPVQK